jgi:hypothetical protein
MRKILSQYPLFLLTIPGTYLVHVANYYYRLLDWKPVIGEILLYVAIPLIIYAVLARFPRLWQKAGVFIFFFLVVFYFFHVWHEWLNISYSIHLPLLGIAAVLLIIYLFKRKASFGRFYYIGNLVFCLLLIGGIAEHIYLRLATDGSQHDQADPSKKLAGKYIPCDTCAKPDIYFVILDGYTNSKTLRTEFGYDNAWIENFLGNKNFYTPAHSKSNYYFTQPSLASILNLDYLHRLDTEKIFHTKEFFQSHYTIYNSELCAILKKQGYAINNFSIFDLQDHPSQVSPFLEKLVPRSITGQTFFHKLNRDIGFHWNRFTREKRIQAVVRESEDDITRIGETLSGVINVARADRSAPQFTYAHFILPHETFYFDSTGKKNDVASIARKGKLPANNYITQVAYTNHFVMAPMVDTIFAHAKRPFVIIFQGDHGYRDYPPEKLALEFENFSAFYFPDGQYAMLNDSMSSVNTFRIVLNHFFHQHLPLLKDSSVYLKKRVK